MEENVTYHFNQKQLKKQVREWKFKKKVHKVKKEANAWIDENKDAIRKIALPIIVTSAAKGITAIPTDIRRYNKRKVQEKKDLSYRGFELTRKLTNKDKVYIQSRTAQGERLGVIFKDMGILK